MKIRRFLRLRRRSLSPVGANPCKPIYTLLDLAEILVKAKQSATPVDPSWAIYDHTNPSSPIYNPVNLGVAESTEVR